MTDVTPFYVVIFQVIRIESGFYLEIFESGNKL
jgi:hypothetical protein